MLKLYLCEWELPGNEYETARIEVAVVWAENEARALKLLKDQVVGTENWEHGKTEVTEVPLHPSYPHVVYSHGGYIE
jgi:hypothetical protein